MKKFLFYFLISVLLALPVFAANQTQTTKQDDIEQTITLINQHKYDEALKLIYSVKIPSNKEERVRYYLAKIKALESTPYYSNDLVESKTDPTKFTDKQKQDAIKQSYKELWNLRTTLVNMPYKNYKKYLNRETTKVYYMSLYDVLVDGSYPDDDTSYGDAYYRAGYGNNFLRYFYDQREKVYEESYKLGGNKRDNVREHWHLKYIDTAISIQNSSPVPIPSELRKKQQKDLAELYAAISDYDKNYNGKYKKYFFEAKEYGKYYSALKSAHLYNNIEDYQKAHDLAVYCSPRAACVSLVKSLEAPSAYLTKGFSQNYKPNTVLPLEFKARNVKQVNFKLYKLSLEQVIDREKPLKLEELDPFKVYTQDLTYDKPYTPKDFKVELPGLERGFYVLSFNWNRDGKENNDGGSYINVTDLALLATNYANTDDLNTLNYKDTSINFYTLSAQNGTLIPNVNIKADKMRGYYWNNPTKIGELNVKTNKNGQVNVKSTDTLQNIVAKYKDNYALIDYLNNKQGYSSRNSGVSVSVYITLIS